MKPIYNNSEEPLVLLVERNVWTSAALVLIVMMLALFNIQPADSQTTKCASVPLLMLPLLIDMEDTSIHWYGSPE